MKYISALLIWCILLPTSLFGILESTKYHPSTTWFIFWLIILVIAISTPIITLLNSIKDEKDRKTTDAMIIKKLRFVARATLQNVINIKLTPEDMQIAEDRAEQVFYADNVI